MYKHMADSIKETNERSFISSTERETFDSKADPSHNHDDRYYTKSYIDSRLDVLYKTVEGEHIKSTSVSGFTKDLEILGNTKQRVETINVPLELEVGGISHGNDAQNDGCSRSSFIPVKYLDNIFMTNDPGKATVVNVFYYREDKSYYDIGPIDSNFVIKHPDIKYIRIHADSVRMETIKLNITRTHLDDIQSVGTKLGENNYQFNIISKGYQQVNEIVEEPYELYKQTIELPVPLECIEGGNSFIRDRLFVENNRLYIEKHISTQILSNINSLKNSTVDSMYSVFHIKNQQAASLGYDDMIITDIFQTVNDGIRGTNSEYCGIYADGTEIFFKILKSRLTADTQEAFNKWVSENNITVKYVSKTPEIIDLGPVESFNIKTINGHIEIVSDNTPVEPTIKCKLPDSIGGSISSINNAIIELKNEIKSLNSVVEKGNTDIEIKNGVGSIPNTHKGQYINDLSIEGKTLVNLSDTYNKKTWLNENPSEAGFSRSNGYFKIDFDVVYENNAFITDESIPINAGKTYTYIVNITENKLTRKVELFPYMWENAINKSESEHIEPGFVGRKVFKFDCIKDTFFEFGYRHNNQSGIGSYKVGKIMVLEGDHTQNPPPYFEGIKSVGQDVNEIVISSVKGDGNLFDTEGLTYSKSINLVAGIHYNEAYTETDQPQKRLIGLPIRLPQNSNLKTYFKYEGYQIAHAFFDKDLRFVQDRSWKPNTINISPRANEVYVSSYFKRDDDTIMSQSDIEFIKQNAIVTESDNFESITYTPYQSIKKTLLYYNEESQIWEKPILRSLPNGIKDTIEKHSDGKYYYHKRCEEIVLNGNEKDISIHGGVSVEGRTTIVIPYVRHYSLVYPTSSVHVYCDKLTPSSRDGLSDKSNVICFHGFNYTDSTTYNAWIGISVDNSKLDSHGLEGVKKWLSINTPTVIIPAITGKIEEVYECTNIDLQTFDNVTNIHVNSGSIPAIIKGSVTTTLSNTLSVLMDKIEVLEYQDIVLNRIKLRSTYESYKTNFNIDIQSAYNSRSMIDPDNDIFKLLYLVISEGSHNYNRYEVEEQIDFYTIIEVLDYDMADYLFNLIDSQHPIYEEEYI